MSKKIVNGKLVDRTPEEEADLQRRREKAGYRDNVKEKFKRRARIEGPFVALTWKRVDKLNNAGFMSKTMGVYLVLVDKNYQRHGPFPLPTKDLDALNIDRTAQARAVTKLEKEGLISVVRKHKHAPIVFVK